MANAPINFAEYARADWQALTTPVAERTTELVTPHVLQNIKAFNDEVSMADVFEVYKPLVDYLLLRKAQYDRNRTERLTFLNHVKTPAPFVIGIAGPVAVGKSTTARLLQFMLQAEFGEEQVALTTTDGFLLSNAELQARGIMQRKGFPESYDMRGMLDFMDTVKDGTTDIRSPKYSHDISDVVADEFDVFERPEIFIIEGINTLQATVDSPVYLSDFFDVSIYVDADTKLIEEWYLERFRALLRQTKQKNDTTNFFWSWTQVPITEAESMAHDVWQTVNLVNLEEYILPTRERADIVLHKAKHHEISDVWLRKF
ncbi:type I pantothenate kinase [Weissella diestrammenae]|uniref:Pantothenate kinase n=1 Tax=Weissella diestrammenae TaxID=1162633 RepID=A0A7G9T446_9LACO|nr:type I pantothenate kinase [Weissella diestrammenae]MCM0583392.1 type I pantothenate kinase [Weissella diestrammenae]QNN74871.1 type I pantothenate kinase [Weissella diestrammenae]